MLDLTRDVFPYVMKYATEVGPIAALPPALGPILNLPQDTIWGEGAGDEREQNANADERATMAMRQPSPCFVTLTPKCIAT